jgi:type VI secretion system protein VasG
VKEGYKANFEYAPELVETIAARCKESQSGARNVENILSRTLLPELSAEVLSRLAVGEAISSVKVGVTPEGAFTYEVS